MKIIYNNIERWLGNLTSIIGVRNYVLIFRESEEQHFMGIDLVTNKLYVLNNGVKNKLQYPKVYVTSRQISGDKSIEDYMKFFTLLKLRAFDVLRLFGEKDESFIRMLGYFQSLDSPCTIISIFLIQAESEVKTKSEIPLDYFSKVNYGHHYFLIVKPNGENTVIKQITQMWQSKNEPEQKILDYDCSYMADFNEDNRGKKVRDLWQIFNNHKETDNYRPITGKLKNRSFYINRNYEYVLIELLIQLKKVADESQAELPNAVNQNYDWLYETGINDAVQRFKNAQTEVAKIQELLNLKVAVETYMVQFFQHFKNKHVHCPRGIQKDLIINIENRRFFIVNHRNTVLKPGKRQAPPPPITEPNQPTMDPENPPPEPIPPEAKSGLNTVIDPIPQLILPQTQPQEHTVIFLGESGVGKSTLISGLGNYLNWPTFEEAKKNQMQICIPVEFKVQRKLEEGRFDETTVRAGVVEDNENFNSIGQSVTQKPKVHEFTFQNNTVKVIDTPGLSDTRGAEQDKKNLELIRECIHDQKEIHAICIVLKSNESKLGNQFELAIRDLLSLFPKSALKNVFFFFTYARGTYFGIGDILNPLKELQQKFRDSHGVTFEFEGRNMCPVDSESFRYLLCKEQGIKYSSSEEERFEYCWNETAKQMCDFLNFIKTVKPIEKKITLAVHHLVTTALRLEEFIRTSDQLTLEQKDSLVKESKVIMSTARKYSMVIEYHRLTTDVTNWKIEEFCESCDQCEKIVKTVDEKLSADISEHVKETGYLLQSHNEAEKVNHEDKHVISQTKVEEVVNNSKQAPIANADQQNSEEDISSFEIINNDENKKVSTETSSTENDTIGQISKENGTSASSLPITTKSPLVEKPEMSPPLAEVTPEWDNIITVHTEHETIPVLIVPSPPAVTEGWNKIITEYTEHDTMPFIEAPPSPPQEFTVIFLGESGVGKSTLISGLGNYLNWPTFEEAKKNQMQVCIPLQFKVQRRGVDKKIIETIVTAGDPEDNENFNDIGQSVTQKPKVHEFTFQNNTVKVIDTPGLSDSRGAEQDKENLRLIRECIHNQKEIHAICIVLKSNDARLRPEFELALRDLLSLFPKPALKNVFFFFTYASGTFFGIGDSTGPVKEMQKKIQDSHEATYSFEGENTCAVDSESFKFLLCKERGVKYSNRPEEDFDFCWNESAAQVKDFLTFIKTVKPIEKKITLAVHHLATTALSLEEFIRTTDQLTQRKRDHLVNESKIILNVARKWSMVTEYHRLIIDLEHWSVDEFKESCKKCEKFLKNVNTNFTKETFKRLKKENNLLMVKNATQITTLPNLVVVSPSVSSAPSLPKSKPFTIIFLGESGVGKSTLISGLGNYLNWPTFEEAKKNKMQVCIPLQFKVQRRGVDKKIIETIVTAGDPEDNENFNDIGQSVTQKPKVHEFTFQNNTVKVIDTPGLSDTRGAEQDKENLRLIRECIHNQKEIHAICIVLKSNDARLRPEFELALRDLLSLFPKPALKNVFFFFTYASGTFFGIGDSTGPVKEMQKKIQDSHEATYSFKGENTCAVDSESFKFLLCKERGVKYSNRPEEDFDFCWNESAAQVKDFLTFIKTVKPIEKKTTLAVHHLVSTALSLEEFIRTNDQLSVQVRDELKKEVNVIFSAAKECSMVTEYHRLLTNVECENEKKLHDAILSLGNIIEREKLNISFDISKWEKNLPEWSKIEADKINIHF